MDGEWVELRSLEPITMWEPGCPLIIEKMTVVKNSTSGKLYLRATLLNIGAKETLRRYCSQLQKTQAKKRYH